MPQDPRPISRALARGLPGALGPPPIPVWSDDVFLSFTDQGGNPLSAPVNLLGPEGPAGNATNYQTRTRAIASVIPLILLSIRVLAFADGYPIEPATYVPGISSGPSAFQDAASNWWQLDLSGSLHYASWYGVNGDAGDYHSPLQAAVTWAAGKEVRLPPGTVGVSQQVSYHTTVLFASGARISGAGEGLTTIDNRCTAGNACVAVGGSASLFSNGGFIRGIFFTTTTSSAIPAYDIIAAYRFTVENVWVKGLAGNGATISNQLGDADASNIVTHRDCFFLNNGNAGLAHNFAANVVQTTFVWCYGCFFQGNGLCGWYYIGLAGGMVACGFTENGFGAGGQGGLWIANNGGSNAQFTGIGCSCENNYVCGYRIDALQGGEFINCEIAGGVIVSTTGFNLNGSVNVDLIGTRVRIGAGLTPFTAFAFGAGSNSNRVKNSYWQSWNDSTQERYTFDVLAIGNIIEGGAQIGSVNGVGGITCASGSNHNIALPWDGEIYGIGGPSAAFTLGGLTSGYESRKLSLFNNSGQSCTLLHEDGASTAANRIQCPGGANLVLGNLTVVNLAYFGFLQRWVVMSHT